MSTPLKSTLNIHEAILSDNVENVDQYLTINPSYPLETLDKFGSRPLHYVNSVDMAKLLLDKGANINSVTDNNSTLLHLAIQRNEKELIRFLVARGANLNEEDVFGKTPLIYAIQTKQADVVQLLLEHGALSM